MIEPVTDMFYSLIYFFIRGNISEYEKRIGLLYTIKLPTGIAIICNNLHEPLYINTIWFSHIMAKEAVFRSAHSLIFILLNWSLAKNIYRKLAWY